MKYSRHQIKTMTNRIGLTKLQRFTLTVLIPLLFSCSDETARNKDEQILARIGDKVINTNEFLQRSEYAIRPPYCRENSYIHKKIVLNSLIAEKLLAMEAGDENPLVNNPDFMAYLQGRKEQAMRQVQYYETCYKNSVPDENEIKTEIEYTNRRYDISYLTVKEEKIAEEIRMKFAETNLDLDAMYHLITGDSVAPQRQVAWTENENFSIRKALFVNKPRKNEQIGPINIDDEKYIFIKINGWVDAGILSENDFREQYSAAYEKIRGEKAWRLYKKYVGELMQGKQINFYDDTFKEIVRIVAPFYIKSAEMKNEWFNNSFWQNGDKDKFISEGPDDLSKLDNKPFFSINGRIWTVERFRDYLKKHPLQFRKEKPQSNNFAMQFKLAVVDMVRDYYITMDAYDKKFDESEIVKHEEAIWRDHLLSLYQKYRYLESQNIKEENQIRLVEQYMTPYIEQLQAKFSDEIEINTENLEEVQLSRIDMIAIHPDQPFPIVVPSFPLVTNDNRLDYGKLMQ